jgi:hypothetical protein
MVAGAYVPSEIVNNFATTRVIPPESVLKWLIKESTRPDCQLEGLVEFKAQFAGDNEAWLNLLRQIVGFTNAGGGIIVFGINNQNQRVGLEASIVAELDPANIINKLQRYAPNASVPTAYIEILYYQKRYGILFIGKSARLLVFDKAGNVTIGSGKSRTLIQPGVVYVRGEGLTREARQIEIDRLVSDRIAEGLTAFLARIERVAALPPGNELLARKPGSDRAHVLAAEGQGIPVTVSNEEDSSAVKLAEVLSPEAPLSTLDAEVAGQLRQWNADKVHTVRREILMRWYLGRANLTPMAGRAKFCFLSAIHDRGYPMYWASQMERSELKRVLREVVDKRTYPDYQVVPYVVGAFFFSRRAELMADFEPKLPGQLKHVIKRLRDAASVDDYLTRGRLPQANTVRVGATVYVLSELMAARSTEALRLFDHLMSFYPEGNVPESERQTAHQLDIMVNGDRES